MRWLLNTLGRYRARLVVGLIPEVVRSQGKIDQLVKQALRHIKELQQLNEQAESSRQNVGQLHEKVVSNHALIEQLHQQIALYRQDIEQLGSQVASDHETIERLHHLGASRSQEIDQLSQRISQYRREIEELRQEVKYHHRDLSEEVVRQGQELDQLGSKWRATAEAETRYRKEARCRQLITSAIAQYFIKGERNEYTSIAFEKVKVDSDAIWIPEILGRKEVSEPEFMVFKHFGQDTGTILDIGANYG